MPVVERTKVYKDRRNTSLRDYKTLYRFEEENVQWLTQHFLGESNETRGGALTN